MSLQRFIFATDLHGDMMEPAVVAALLAFCKEWKPHIKVFGGDLFDFMGLWRERLHHFGRTVAGLEPDAG